MYAYNRGFAALFSKYLCIAPDDQVVVIYDEAFEPYMQSMVSALGDNKVYTTFCFLPTMHQQMLVMNNGTSNLNSELILPSGLKAAISNANVIVNLLSPTLSFTPIRKAIVLTRRRAESKLAHIPGIGAEILDLMECSPIKEIEVLGEMLAWSLGEAHDAELVTRDGDGQAYHLSIGLDGWITEPIISTGIIRPGSWGNAVPGETFCCPDYQEVNGEICINGSIPGLVLDKKDQIILTFKNGKLTDFRPVYKDSRAMVFFRKEKNKSKNNGDSEWNTFAELGIGLNPMINKLTGNPIFDEKLLGNIHVAIGDNSAFGHDVRSKIHADLVVLGAGLYLEGKKVIADGEVRKKSITRWRNSLDLTGRTVNEKALLMLNHGKLSIKKDGVYRQLAKSKRLGFVKILDKTYVEDCHKLQLQLPEGEEVIFRRLLNSKTLAMPKEKLSDLVNTLRHYKIMTIKQP